MTRQKRPYCLPVLVSPCHMLRGHICMDVCQLIRVNTERLKEDLFLHLRMLLQMQKQQNKFK